MSAEPLRAAAPPAEAITPQLLKSAKKEGKCSFYTAMDLQFAEQLGKAFEQKYPGISVKVERSGAERVFTRIAQENQSNIAAVDVVNTADAAHVIVWKRNKWLAAYLPQDVEQHFDKSYYDADAFAVVTRILVSPIAYNTDLVKKEDATKSFADLLDPKWAGKMVKAHPAYTGTIMNSTSSAPAASAGILSRSSPSNTSCRCSRRPTRQRRSRSANAPSWWRRGLSRDPREGSGQAGRDRLSDRRHAARDRPERHVPHRRPIRMPPAFSTTSCTAGTASR